MREHIEAIERAVDRDEQFIDAATTVALRAAITAALAEAERVDADYQRAREAWVAWCSGSNERAEMAEPVLDAFFNPSGEG